MSKKRNLGHNSKKDFLKNPVEHIDITSFDSRKIIQKEVLERLDINFWQVGTSSN